jgi:hypothetical protein
MSASDLRQAVIKAAILNHAMVILKRMGATAAQVALELNNAAAEMERDAPDGLTPREREAEARQARRADMLAMLDRLVGEGKGPRAPTLIALKYARNARDPVEVESLARSVRNWRKNKFRKVSESRLSKRVERDSWPRRSKPSTP